jgi:cytidylate kinase
MQKVIAIDGPSGSGKSTMAKRLAERMGLIYIDTGAMFRGLALVLDRHGIPFQEGKALTSALSQIDFQYARVPGVLVEIAGEDLTHKIREHKVSELASRVSQLPSVRQFLLKIQRSLGEKRLCVMEGRDIGTVVFPEAFCKFFVTASIEVRAMRRLMQLEEKGETRLNLEQVQSDVKLRDKQDAERAQAPLIQAEDAVLVDTSAMDEEGVLAHLEALVRERAQECGFTL